MRKIGLVIVMFSFTTVGFSQTNVANKFGKGFYNVIAEDSSYSMKLAVRFQTLYLGEWDIDGEDGIQDGTSNFLIRRARLKFGGFIYNPKVVYKIEFALSNRDMSGASAETKNAPRYVLDAVVKWNFAGNFVLWAGQTKLPGNRERVISSANLQFVDRSMLNSKFNIDRDMGVQLRHHFVLGESFTIREMASFAQGDGRNITVKNIGGYQYTGRIEILPMGKFASKGDYIGGDMKREEKPKLSIALSYDYNENAVRQHGNLKNFMYNDIGYYETTVSTVFADLMFKWNGVSLMAEYANKQAVDPIAKNSDGTETGDNVYVGQGFNVALGYLLKSNWEIAGRYTTIIPESFIGSAYSQYTLGVSRYIVGHKLKVQGDVSYNTFNSSNDAGLMTRLQIDVHF
ncbi:MAG: porin [Flavobacteriales bacterium]|nr:porin [Flavobacteriales bacterium]